MTSGGQCAAIYAVGSLQCRCSTDHTLPISSLVTVLMISYVLITNLMHKFSLFLYNIPLHVSSNNAHLQEVTLLYTCSIWYHHSENKGVVNYY